MMGHEETLGAAYATLAEGENSDRTTDCGTRIRLGGAEMWKPEHRRAAERRGLRYPSDLTDTRYAGSRRRSARPQSAHTPHLPLHQVYLR